MYRACLRFYSHNKSGEKKKEFRCTFFKSSFLFPLTISFGNLTEDENAHNYVQSLTNNNYVRLLVQVRRL